MERLPGHIAIIMDGNGRWAAQRHLPRVEGHRAGITSVRQALARAEGSPGAQRQDALTQLASQLDTDASRSADAAKVRALAGAVRTLAK